MLMKIRSRSSNHVIYYENIVMINISTDRHPIDCDCETCHIANKKLFNLKQTNSSEGWAVYPILIEQKNEDAFAIECGPGDEIYLMNDQGKTIDKILVPIN